VRFGAVTRQPDDHAAGIASPERRGQSREGRNKIDTAAVGDGARERLDVSCRFFVTTGWFLSFS
jgi:hypothetical protein